MKELLELTCSYYEHILHNGPNITPENAMKYRFRPFPEIRGIVMKILYENGGLSLQDIGNLFSKNHATVLHWFRVIPELIETDKNFASRYKKIKQEYEERKENPFIEKKFLKENFPGFIFQPD